MQYVLVETSFAAPEQYDVYWDSAKVGAIRVRNGCLSVDVRGTVVHDALVAGDGRMVEGERYDKLIKALKAIHMHFGRELGFAFYVQGTRSG